MAPQILLVDDEPMVVKALERLLDENGYECQTSTSPIDALQKIDEHSFELVIADQRMPMLLGHELLHQIRQKSPSTRTVLVSAYSDFNDVVSAFNSGVIDQFVPKPWDDLEFIDLVASLLQQATSGEAPWSKSGGKPQSSLQEFRGILSNSPAMHEAFSKLKKAAVANVPVFIYGETGTGKEMSAHSIHAESARANQPFVSFNCANFSDTLMESQLFGHKKGAFTGAISDQPGLLNEVGSGTLFLDEVTSMDIGLQAKLLRVLQEREFSMVGSYKIQPFHGQVVSASSLSLDEAVDRGGFREDLRYRLEVIRVSLPPLRERPEDILPLFELFLQQNAQGKPPKLSPVVKEKLLRYRWPGNVRQLQNAAMYSAAMCETGQLDNENLPRDIRTFDLQMLSPLHGGEAKPIPATRTDDPPPLQNAPAPGDKSTPSPSGKPVDVSEEDLNVALKTANGNKSHAARELGISRMTLWRLMKKYNLEE